MLRNAEIQIRSNCAQSLRDQFANPGWVFQPVGERLLVAVRPWPDYGQTGTPAWPVRVMVVGPEVRRYELAWSTRLQRWAVGAPLDRMRRDLAISEQRNFQSHVLDVLHGGLA